MDEVSVFIHSLSVNLFAAQYTYGLIDASLDEYRVSMFIIAKNVRASL
jgi:hypothetical protein